MTICRRWTTATSGASGEASLNGSPYPHQIVDVPGPEAEAHRCEKTDPPRAAALYRRAIVDCLDGADPLGSQAGRRDLQRLYDRLSLVLKRSGLTEEALEEIDSAAYLGLVDDHECGTKAHREALSKRRDTLRRAASRRQAATETTLHRACRRRAGVRSAVAQRPRSVAGEPYRSTLDSPCGTYRA